MRQFVIRAQRCCPVTFGEVKLFLTRYQVTSQRTLAEEATPEGVPYISASWDKGTRLILEGLLPPEITFARATANLAAVMRSGEPQNVVFDSIRIPNAVLCQYTFKAIGNGIQMSLVLFTTMTPEEVLS